MCRCRWKHTYWGTLTCIHTYWGTLTCIHTCMSIEAHIDAHTHTCMLRQTYMHKCTSIHGMHAYTYTNITHTYIQDIYMHTHIHTHAFIHTYMHTHTHAYTHTYTHTCTHNHTHRERARWRAKERDAKCLFNCLFSSPVFGARSNQARRKSFLFVPPLKIFRPGPRNGQWPDLKGQQ